jgi:hypothetical protein
MALPFRDGAIPGSFEMEPVGTSESLFAYSTQYDTHPGDQPLLWRKYPDCPTARVSKHYKPWFWTYYSLQV